MSTAIEQALKATKAALKAKNPIAAAHAVLPAIKRFPSNARLLAALADVQSARTGLPAKPFGPAHIQRLLRMRAQAPLPAIAEEVQVALLLDPNSVLANAYFGSLLLELGSPEAAIAPLRLALSRAPENPEAATNLAFALWKAGLGAEAADVARKLLVKHPNLTAARIALGLALVEDGLPRQAAKVFQDLIQSTPPNADFHYELGRALSAAQDFTGAIAAFEAGLALNPKHLNTLNELGTSLMNSGAFDRATALFEAAIAAHPQSGSGYYNLARAVDLPPDDARVVKMQSLAATSRPTDKILLNFGLAKTFEAAGDPPKSFAALKAANDLRRAELAYEPAFENHFFANLKARHWAPDTTLTPTTAAQPRPIFILGMMRSGTTLMEQIISAHPQVYGAGELDYLGKAVMAEMRVGDAPFDRATQTRIREYYLTRIANLPTDRPWITDKMPANFALVGVILRALPEARIIHMRRDPIAVCWSIYKKNFSGNRLRFSNDLGDIAAYYDHYADYMAFAEAQAPGAICHVDYAELTKTPDPVIRRVLDYCDLPFDAACLAPEKNDRTIQTASFQQARSGIYQGSTSKWRGFEPYLKPLIDHFAAKPG